MHNEGIINEYEDSQAEGALADEEIIMEKLVANPVHVLKVLIAALTLTIDCTPRIVNLACKLSPISSSPKVFFLLKMLAVFYNLIKKSCNRLLL